MPHAPGPSEFGGTQRPKTHAMRASWSTNHLLYCNQTATLNCSDKPVGVSRGMPLQEICKIGLSKMQLPAFPGLELLNWEGLLGVKKCSQKMKYFTDLAIIILSICSCWLF